MRIPPGVTERTMANIIDQYEVELVHTDYGPVIKGEITVLEEIRDYIIKDLNQRINEFEKKE